MQPDRTARAANSAIELAPADGFDIGDRADRAI